jgi:hypothetical protein
MILKKAQGCGHLIAVHKEIHTYNNKGYCSKGCLARAKWRMEPAPESR